MDAATDLINGLMAEYAPPGWTWRWDRARLRAGATFHYYARITFSRALFAHWSQDAIRSTVLHEIAHARAGYGAGHGYKWKQECRAIGIPNEEACYTPGPGRELLPSRYVGRCPAGHEFSRERLPKYRHSCNQCSPRGFDANHAITWERR